MRGLRRVALSMLVALLLVASVPWTAFAARPTPALRVLSATATTERVSGGTRYETAVEVSKRGWDYSDYVVIATGENFPDALAGSPLAAAYEAPLLLTQGRGLPSAVADEISRLGASQAFVLGGPTVVSPAVVDELEDMGLSVERISGADRYETAAEIADAVNGQVGTTSQVIVATGLNYPDALAIAGYASHNGIPILLSRTDTLPDATVRAIDRLGVTSSVVVGSERVVSAGVFAGLPDAERIAGADRYETAARIGTYAFEHGFSYSNVFVATGRSFPDALAAGPWAADVTGPVLLSEPSTLSKAADDFLNAHCSSIDNAYILGGTPALSDGVKSAVQKAATTTLASTTRVLDEYSMSLLSSYGPDGTLVFSSADEALDAVSEGDVIVAGASEVAPEGFIRKVTGVSHDLWGGLTFETTDAALEQLFEKGSIDILAPLSDDEGADVLSMRRPQWGFDVGGSRTFLDQSFTEDFGSGGKVTLDGSIKVSGGYSLNAQFRVLTLQKLQAKAMLDESAQLAVKAQLADWSESKEAMIFEKTLPAQTIHVAIPMPPFDIPVVVVPVVQLYVGASGEIKADVTTRVDQSLHLSTGFAYDRDGGWSPIAECTPRLGYTPPTFSASAEAKVWAGPRLNLRLYGLTGPTLQVNAYGKGKADIADDPWWTVTAGVEAKVGMDSAELPIIGKLASHQFDPFELFKPVVVAKAPGRFGAGPGPSGPTGDVAGYVHDARNGVGLANVQVALRQGRDVTSGNTYGTTYTDRDGRFTFSGLPAGEYTAQLTLPGFVTLSKRITCVGGVMTDEQNVGMTPRIAGDEVRVVLDWGSEPSDLDSHITGPDPYGDRFHVYFDDPEYYDDGNALVSLDHDDTDSYGPETITLHEQAAGVYRYSVHDFSHKDEVPTSALGQSGATVRVYKGNTLLRTFHVPAGAGTLWTVFEMSGGVISVVDRMSYEADASAVQSARASDAALIRDVPDKK